MANNFTVFNYPELVPTKWQAKSPAGHDSNIGDAENPIASTPDSQIVQIGTGVYQTTEGIYNSALIGDGKVILKNKSITAFNGSDLRVFINIEFDNCTINVGAGSGKRRAVQDGILRNCHDVFIAHGGGDNYNSYNRVVVINSTFANNSANLPMEKCILIGSTLYLNKEVKDSYVDENSELISVNGFNYLRYCNVNGLITFVGTLFADSQSRSYAIQDGKIGTPQDNGYSAGVSWISEAQLTADGANFAVAGWDSDIATCMNRDPRFLDKGREVFTLQSDSPHIRTASDGGNIGSTKVGKFISPTDSSSNTYVVYDQDIDISNPAEPKLKAGSDKGTIRILHRVVESNTPINFTGRIGYPGLLAFDTDYNGGSIQNNNVPSAVPSVFADKLTTTANSSDSSTIKIDGHGRSAGEFFRYAGQTRQIDSVLDANTFTLDTPLRSPVVALQTVEIGSEEQLTATKPNHIEMLFRSSKKTSLPTVDADFDNDLNVNLGQAGNYFPTQHFTTPVKIISGNNVYGNASPLRPSGASEETFSLIWIDVLITLKNIYQ
jgi:hypothetical protein